MVQRVLCPVEGFLSPWDACDRLETDSTRLTKNLVNNCLFQFSLKITWSLAHDPPVFQLSSDIEKKTATPLYQRH